jgi:flagellar basal-body rod modification protein FlgD
LAAQLQQQDPLSPLDASQFTSQLVQFSTVEQAIRTNSQLEKLTGLARDRQHDLGADFIGLDVGFESRASSAMGETGNAGSPYQAGATGDRRRLSPIRDAWGAFVREAQGDPGAGGPRVRLGTAKVADGQRLPAGLCRDRGRPPRTTRARPWRRGIA